MRKVVVKLQAGFGNNVFQMLTGHVRALRLTAQTGIPHTCEIVIPDAVDFSGWFSIFEVLGGHLRADVYYERRHMDFGLPRPENLPAIFPKLTWRDVSNPVPPTRPEELSDFIANLALQTPRYSASDEEATGVPRRRIGNVVVLETPYPFGMFNWNPEVRSLHPLFAPPPSVYRYLELVYGLRKGDPLVGVHIRNDLRCADVQATEPTPTQWYLDSLAAAIAAAPTCKVVLVANRVAKNRNSGSQSDDVKAGLKRNFPHIEIIESYCEVYYIDFFLLGLCQQLIVAPSTFSFTSALASPVNERIFVSHAYNERHFMEGEFPDYCVYSA